LYRWERLSCQLTESMVKVEARWKRRFSFSFCQTKHQFILTYTTLKITKALHSSRARSFKPLHIIWNKCLSFFMILLLFALFEKFFMIDSLLPPCSLECCRACNQFELQAVGDYSSLFSCWPCSCCTTKGKVTTFFTSGNQL